MTGRALVLAGGGVAGIAWETGVLLGVGDSAPQLRPALIDADTVIGTSAGSTVAAQITSGVDLADLFAAQLAAESTEIEVDVDLTGLMAQYADAAAGATSADDVRRRLGAFALGADTVSEEARMAAIVARLPTLDWPARELLIPAVDGRTGDLMVFSRTSGVSLADAVAASCAVPGVWPPVTIGARRFVDGGVRSSTNADLAAGADRVLVITPALQGAPSLGVSLADEIAVLAPASVFTIYADEASIASFGTNPLSPATRRPAALAGRAVGRAIAAQVAEFWS